MTKAAGRKAAPPRARRAPALAALEDHSPSLLMRLGGEVRGIAAWIVGCGAALVLLWAGLDKVGSWRSAWDSGVAKLAAVDTRLTEINAALAQLSDIRSALAPRLAAVEAIRGDVQLLTQRLGAAETEIATARSLGSQQIEGLRDRMRQIEQGDQEQARQTTEVTRTLSTIAARMDDMLRRMEGVERRLDRSFIMPPPGLPPAHRNGTKSEAPATWLLPLELDAKRSNGQPIPDRATISG